MRGASALSTIEESRQESQERPPIRVLSPSDPCRALLTGFVGGPAPQDWNKFDAPGLRGISKTAPYFHNNSAATLEEVVEHYTEFFKHVRVNVPGNTIPAMLATDGVNVDRPLTSAPERAALLAYVREL